MVWTCEFFKYCLYRAKKGYSIVILVTGIPNSGKTFLGGLLAEFIDFGLNREHWNPKEYCVFDMSQLSQRFINIKKKPILVAEAGYDLAFDTWQSPMSKFFDKILITQRTAGNCYILNIPVAKDLARRHRRKVDFQVDIRRLRHAIIWINAVRRRAMFGNEFKPRWFGEIIGYPKPKCSRILKKLDEENKNRIKADIEKSYKEYEIKVKKNEFENIRYICPRCNNKWKPQKKFPKKCPQCNRPLKIKEIEDGKIEIS